MSSPSPKSDSESPVTIALIEGNQRMRSLSSRPAYAWMPNGHSPGPWKWSLGFACAQPGEILALHPAHLIRIDAELLDPVLPCVGGRRVHREPEPASPALVVRRGQNDSRRALAQLVGDGQ